MAKMVVRRQRAVRSDRVVRREKGGARAPIPPTHCGEAIEPFLVCKRLPQNGKAQAQWMWSIRSAATAPRYLSNYSSGAS
jgi:hypothetical protein